MLIYQNGVVAKTDLRKPDEDEIAFVYLKNPPDAELNYVIRETFGCHPLVLDDCKIWDQRPHLDIYEDHLYMPFYALRNEWELYEMSIVIGRNFVIAIFPEKAPFLDELKDTLKRSPSKMKTSGLLLYEVLDACVHHYSDLVDKVEEMVDDMENRIYENPYVKLAPEIFGMKRKLHKIRRTFTEERNVLGTLMHMDKLFGPEETRYLADIYNHSSQVVEMVDTFRETLTGLIDLQMSIKGDKMNEIMKTLTIVNTIFLPMMFVVGLYGTNVHLPEYNWAMNYLWVWGLLVVSGVFMYFYFKRKKWI